MANVLGMPQYQNRNGYNGFSMGQRTEFTSTTGELLPVYTDLLEPGDKVTCKIDLKTRTQTLAAPAMVHITEHVDWFFVPIVQLYSIFGDWRFQIQDFKSSMFNPQSVSNYFPTALAAEWNTLGNYLTSDDPSASDRYFNLVGTQSRLLEMLDLGLENMLIENLPFSQTPLYLCAYQKIYFDYYRLSDWEANDPSYYNLDQFYSNPMNVKVADLLKFSTLRYRPRRKDFFIHGFSSPLFGSSSTSAWGQSSVQASNIVDSFRQWLVPAVFETAKSTTNSSGKTLAETSNPTSLRPNGTALGSSASAQWNAITALSPDSIRTSFALQKMLEVTRRGGKHYDKQVLAHYGVDVPNGVAGEVMYLGSQNGEVHIGDIYATAAGATGQQGQHNSSVLGQVTGKGFGQTDNGVVKFEAPCHGVLMAVYSADVDLDWSGAYDKLNQLVNLNDWYFPEYDALGAQPLYAYQIGEAFRSAQGYSDVVHWQHRYLERKLKYNRVKGGFARDLSYWTAIAEFDNENNYPSIPVCPYLVSPFALDNIMLVGFAPDVAAGQGWATDPLLHELYCDVKKASRMSTFGSIHL